MDKINQINYLKALEYHQKGGAGKISIVPTKPLVTQQDLALAYSPGVAAPCLEIAKNIDDIYKYTIRGNLVAVISNGTAVLGLGNLGAAASKPVMEGKAVLFKVFADIDSIDLEIDTNDPDEFVNAVKYLNYSFGGINLEDIKAPECFIIEEKLKSCMQIPVFHDDQHGTAIVVAAGLINATYITKRTFNNITIVVNGAGAAAIACIELLIALGVNKANVILCDTKGVIYKGRLDGMNKWKELYASETHLRTLSEAMESADVFIGLSSKGAVSKEMVASMNANPIIFAMANPDPEITPEEIQSVRTDSIIATGRSDYNNQINNVMGFPYIFRGALDVRATTINQEMKMAAANSLAELARQLVPEEVYKAYVGRKMVFGPDYIIPVPFDPRLITTVSIAVAKAAIDSGVAKITDLDFNKYKKELESRLNPTAHYMNLLLERLQGGGAQRIVFAEGEEEEVIMAAIMMRDAGYASPILVGRREKIAIALEKLGITDELHGITIMNAAINQNLGKYIDTLYTKLQRKGYLYHDCAKLVKSDKNVFSACMIEHGDADCMVTGVTKSYYDSLADITKVIEPKENNRIIGYSIMVSKEHNLIIADNSISETPNEDDLVAITLQTANIAKNMGISPKVALLSFSTFGNPMQEKTNKVRNAVKILDSMNLDFEYEGEISANIALNSKLRSSYSFCRLSGSANVLIMPNLDSALISTQLLKELAGGAFIGPIINGLKHPVQIAQMGSSASEIIKIATFACMDAINNMI